MNAIEFDSRMTDQIERELIREEMNLFPLRTMRFRPAGAASGEAAGGRYERALMWFKGALIVGGVVFITITLALQAAARFS